MKRPEPKHLVLAGIVGAMIAAAIGHAALWWWFVEDSAISMAFARNWAEGHGLVRYPGDARVEGYSNPLWVLMMAAGYLVGVDGFQSSKVYAVLLGCLVSVPITWQITRHAKVPQGWAMAAAWVLALDAQFVIWSSCGLENGLFCALLALGCWRTLQEAETGGFPWASVAFLGLALTRPEGIVYAAFGGFFALVLEAVGNRRWGRIAAWLAVFWVPFAVYHAVRFQYFAFEFPATYYSKLEDARFMPFTWKNRAWEYLNGWALETGRGFLLPVFIAGGLSLRGWRGVTVVTLSVWLGVLLLWPGTEWMIDLGFPRGMWTPPKWVELRVVSLGLAAVAVPFLALGSEGWRTRVLLWGMTFVAVLFSLRSTGDWMRGYRWMSLLAVPASALFAIGCADIARAVGGLRDSERWRIGGTVVGVVVLVAGIAPDLAYLVRYQPEVGPFAMKRRVDHYGWARRKLHLEKVDIVDHDMGAMLYWAGEHGIVRDSKGLIDYPFALHHAQRSFVEEYAFREHVFDFAHGHASTGRALRRVPRFNTEYIEIPGYGATDKLHLGNYARKSLLIRDRFVGPTDHRATFQGGVELHGLYVRAPEVQPESWLFLELGLSTLPRPHAPIRMLLVLTGVDGGPPYALDVPLGLDDWYPVTEWKQGEVFNGRITLPIAAEMAPGWYDASVVVLGPDGVLPALTASETGSIPAEEDTPKYARGEVTFPRLVHILPPDDVKAAATADVQQVYERANRGDCAGAEIAWEDARAHYMVSHNWQASVRPNIEKAVGACWAAQARKDFESHSLDDRSAAVHAMRRGRWWSPTHPAVQEVGAELAEAWMQHGLELREAGDIEPAYVAFLDALYADPAKAWARRYAEELRVERLDLR